jgi:hypothetical protein
MTKYQIYANWCGDAPYGWFKIKKPFKTKKEAEKTIKYRQQIVVYNAMNYKIKEVKE